MEDGKEEPWKVIKTRTILEALNSDPVDVKILKHCAVSKGGLLSNEIRRKAWPKLLGINVFRVFEYSGPPLFDHKERAQVMLDVKRCGRRIPEGFNESDQASLQETLARVILRILATHSNLCYYQGLHDVTLTLLLILDDENITFAVLNTLVEYHLRDFVDSNMKYTKQVIGYLSPLLSIVDDKLQLFITRSECQYYFSLSWLITWFSHDIADADIVCRLFDFFMASHPIMPMYCSCAIILCRRDEVLSQECEMSSVHGLLSKLSNEFNYESIIEKACQLYNDYPITLVAKKGRLRVNDSYMNYTHSKFERIIKRQRPDHLLKDLPYPNDSAIISTKSLLVYSSIPLAVGIVLYYLIKHNYLHRLYNLIF